MIDNDYIFEFNLPVDLEYFKTLGLERKDQTVSGILPHQRLVKDDAYMSEIRSLYNFLSPVYNIYSTRPFNSMPPHIDAKRKCAINIPVQNTENTDTVFYTGDQMESEYVHACVYHLIKSPITETFKFSLSGPTLINNTVPHSVINNTDKERIIISWSIDETYTFEDIKSILKQS